MSTPLLSILIPTVVGREEQLNRLVSKLKFPNKNYGALKEVAGEHNGFKYHMIELTSHPVSILIAVDNKEKTVGEKREWLYKESNGIYSWQIDDDDDIAPDAIELILKAIKENPDVDCITFEERCQMNGSLYCANHSLQYGGWEGDGSKLLSDGFHFHRSPFYKNVIKTSIAQSVPFEKIRFGEDHAWSIALYPHLKTEVHIPKQLYYYTYEPKESHNERYGITE